MHNSQGGIAGADGPAEFLVSGGCIGCHTGTNSQGSANLTISADAPYVLDTAGAPLTTSLAGGNFYWVDQFDDTKGHNVVGISTQDGAIGLDPPGWSTNAAFKSNGARANGEANWTSQLTCDGVYGCHGSVGKGVKGSHHNNSNGGSVTAARVNDVGDHFRFLQGIQGYEDKDFEFAASGTDHNKYKGEVREADAVLSTNTMTYFCSSCHGEFHANNGGVGLSSSGTMTSPWVRHPVDIKLPTGVDAYDLYTDYDVTVPMAYSNTTTPPVADDIQADGIITCLTCHVAHGSAYADLLRWDYANFDVGEGAGLGGTGCFVCHSDKDGI